MLSSFFGNIFVYFQFRDKGNASQFFFKDPSKIKVEFTMFCKQKIQWNLREPPIRKTLVNKINTELFSGDQLKF